MAVLPINSDLEKRQNFDNCPGYGWYSYSNGCYYSGWNAYGRWILLAAIVVGAFLLYLIFSCITVRNRRRRGLAAPRGLWAPYAQGYSQGPNQGYQGPPNQGYNQGQSYAPVYNSAQQPQDNYGPPPSYPQQESGTTPRFPDQAHGGGKGSEIIR